MDTGPSWTIIHYCHLKGKHENKQKTNHNDLRGLTYRLVSKSHLELQGQLCLICRFTVGDIHPEVVVHISGLGQELILTAHDLLCSQSLFLYVDKGTARLTGNAHAVLEELEAGTLLAGHNDEPGYGNRRR